MNILFSDELRLKEFIRSEYDILVLNLAEKSQASHSRVNERISEVLNSSDEGTKQTIRIPTEPMELLAS